MRIYGRLTATTAVLEPVSTQNHPPASQTPRRSPLFRIKRILNKPAAISSPFGRYLFYFFKLPGDIRGSMTFVKGFFVTAPKDCGTRAGVSSHGIHLSTREEIGSCVTSTITDFSRTP